MKSIKLIDLTPEQAFDRAVDEIIETWGHRFFDVVTLEESYENMQGEIQFSRFTIKEVIGKLRDRK